MGDDDVKRLILARRAKFVAAALVSLNAAMCGGSTETTQPEPCLSPRDPGRVDAGEDTGTPQPCLSVQPTDAGPGEDAGPQPCLSPPFDAGEDADAGPQPCLKMPMRPGG